MTATSPFMDLHLLYEVPLVVVLWSQRRDVLVLLAEFVAFLVEPLDAFLYKCAMDWRVFLPVLTAAGLLARHAGFCRCIVLPNKTKIALVPMLLMATFFPFLHYQGPSSRLYPPASELMPPSLLGVGLIPPRLYP